MILSRFGVRPLRRGILAAWGKEIEPDRSGVPLTPSSRTYWNVAMFEIEAAIPIELAFDFDRRKTRESRPTP